MIHASALASVGSTAAECANECRVQGQLDRKQEQLRKMQISQSVKEDLKTVALGTSKINYLDPRITVAWCKRLEVCLLCDLPSCKLNWLQLSAIAAHRRCAAAHESMHALIRRCGLSASSVQDFPLSRWRRAGAAGEDLQQEPALQVPLGCRGGARLPLLT